MKNHSLTYRLIAGFTAWILIAGTVLPAGLHAKGKNGSNCQKPVKTTASQHGDCHMDAGEQGKAKHSDCDWGFACSCSLDEAPVKTQANKVNSSPALSIFTGSVDHIIPDSDHFISGHYHYQTDIDSSPPLFLKHGSFLN